MVTGECQSRDHNNRGKPRESLNNTYISHEMQDNLVHCLQYNVFHMDACNNIIKQQQS